MESTATRRAACFIEENYGLASIAAGADMEAGFSGNHFLSRPLCAYSVSSTKNRTTNNTLTNPSSFSSVSVSSPTRSGRFYDARFEVHQLPHFLDSCSFCNKPIGDNRDIFMYRGDTPFCSEECRQEQIEIDEAKEKDLNLSSMKALRKKEQSKSPNKNSQKCPFRTGAVAAA